MSCFQNRFIVVSDTESNPLRQYQVSKSSLVYVEKMILENVVKLVMLTFFLSSIFYILLLLFPYTRQPLYLLSGSSSGAAFLRLRTTTKIILISRPKHML